MKPREVSQSRILVTGAGGFIGGALARGLQATGKYDVIGICRDIAPELENYGIRVMQCDLEKGLAFDEPVDFIIHCAAVQDFEVMPIKDFIETNLAITENVARFGKFVGVKGVIYTSSVTLHGEIRNGEIDELSGIINPSIFGVSKYLCEKILQNYEEFFPTVSLRLCGVVGSGAKRIWLSKVKAEALRGEDITIVNSDKLFNNLLHTDDLLKFIQLLAENGFSGFSTFPIASIEAVSVREVVNEVIESLKSSSRVIDKGSIPNSFIISNRFATEKFGYKPASLLDGLRRYIQS